MCASHHRIGLVVSVVVDGDGDHRPTTTGDDGRGAKFVHRLAGAVFCLFPARPSARPLARLIPPPPPLTWPTPRARVWRRSRGCRRRRVHGPARCSCRPPPLVDRRCGHRTRESSRFSEPLRDVIRARSRLVVAIVDVTHAAVSISLNPLADRRRCAVAIVVDRDCASFEQRR